MICIGTPMYGDQCWKAYHESMSRLIGAFKDAGMDYSIVDTGNESLIHRARNATVQRFLNDTDAQKLIFIDADIQFDPESVARLWNHDLPVVGGLYRMKRPATAEAGLDDTENATVIWRGIKYAGWKDGEVIVDKSVLDTPDEVDYLGTGFLMIDRKVFVEMEKVCPFYVDPVVGNTRAWFNTRVEGDVLLSEDYAFCHDYRRAGGKIYADPSIDLIHWGVIGYGP